MVIAVGNDTQFAKLCELIALPELPRDERFRTNVSRVKNRAALVPQIQQALACNTVNHWIETLTAVGVPCGPINNLQQVFDDPHVQHRGIRTEVPHPRAGTLPILANPARLSATPPSYERPPPLLGEHTREVLSGVLGLPAAEIDALAADGII
jgi:crotonobetainyl-CoA:carnitine CoA-transferase CaiB-like acyl-CoA transferase